jgi:hypothetical protein
VTERDERAEGKEGNEWDLHSNEKRILGWILRVCEEKRERILNREWMRMDTEQRDGPRVGSSYSCPFAVAFASLFNRFLSESDKRGCGKSV